MFSRRTRFSDLTLLPSRSHVVDRGGALKMARHSPPHRQLLYRWVIGIIWLGCCVGMIWRSFLFFSLHFEKIPIGRVQDTSGSVQSGGSSQVASGLLQLSSSRTRILLARLFSINCSMTRSNGRKSSSSALFAVR